MRNAGAMECIIGAGGTFAFVLLGLAACDPVFHFQVQVEDPAGAAIEGAVLVLTDCPRQNEHSLGTLAAMTDEGGEASVGSTGTSLPPCNVTVAKPGYFTQQFSFDELCGGNRDDCDRSQTMELVLEPTP